MEENGGEVEAPIEAQQAAEAVERVPQIEDTKRKLANLLGEIGESPETKFPENSTLREKWIDGVGEKLKEPSPEGQDVVVIPTFADASLASQSNRGFFAAFSDGLSQSEQDETLPPALKYDNIEDFKRIASSKPDIPRVEVQKQREPGPRWVVNDQGERSLATNTRLDGVQVLWDGSAISKPNSLDRTVRPVFIISR